MIPVPDPSKKAGPGKTGKPVSRRDLREAAEGRLAEHPAIQQELGRPERDVHELQVHQIELEMQNEALRETQHALEESRDKFADLYDFAPVGYLTLSKNATISEANLTAASFLGVNRHQLIDDRIRKFIDGGDLDRWDRYFMSVLKNSGKRVCELNLRKGDGTPISARLESIRLDRDREEPVIRTAISDITGRVLAERSLARKSRDLDELNSAYATIETGQEELRKTVAELSAREGELKDALEEKEVLLAEIHHRVKNNLTALISLLNLDSSYEETPAGLTLKRDLQNRARSMALVHDTLYKTKKYSEVDMGVYLPNLVSNIASSFPGSGRINIVAEANGVMLDIARATPCGLIINELVTNSFKYAFPDTAAGAEKCRENPVIGVKMTQQGELYELRVYDTGVGLGEEIDVKTTQSLGLKLVSFLARHQLRATVAVARNPGTEYVIRFGPARPVGK